MINTNNILTLYARLCILKKPLRWCFILLISYLAPQRPAKINVRLKNDFTIMRYTYHCCASSQHHQHLCRVHKHTRTLAYAETHMHTHAYTHARTHTHTQTNARNALSTLVHLFTAQAASDDSGVVEFRRMVELSLLLPCIYHLRNLRALTRK